MTTKQDKSSSDRVDPLRYYSLETFLFVEVHNRFHANGCLGAFDFFSIVIWKANRAKSKVALRLCARRQGDESLDAIVRRLTRTIAHCSGSRERLHLLMNGWGFLLPMATAILTVMYPEEFTVYDVRVCESFPEFCGLGNLSKFDRLWPDYLRYCESVRASHPGRSLRDNDRYLWAISAMRKLKKDIDCDFRDKVDVNAH